ncbi:hypothetical protein [Lapillicoccus jejuensis]|uniref:Uncharacterized protein n=1 Tax=Lapillicoccus jejuensis TaxID=402171 RepID=A0A542E352_9MICO|nr:hypothetical protein [Lapillicoccus jejuensis]TQJ09762.1 hypothetical protein FB458_2878 [Lapillicoccus jejuensis]
MDDDTAVADDLALLRAFEPVLRLTAGEYFVPVGVQEWVTRARLWHRGPDDRLVEVAAPGELTLDGLAELGVRYDGAPLALSGLPEEPTRLQRARAWFRAVRPHFRASDRLARVGLAGRVVDVVGRVSLLFRGAVPGGSAAAAVLVQDEHLDPARPRYHGRVLRDGDWVVLQYWFFYCFNNWRSGFSGVNEHEGDWEQVTVYLDATTLDGPGPDGVPVPRWVVFSSHDEVGDDLRRRWDDPDLTLVGRHPVVHVGAGSHSGAFLPGEYLVTVVPPRWGGIVGALRWLAKLLTPWTRAAQGGGLGIPYVDYARGDGVTIGPAGQLAWTPVVIDDTTPWVRDYRGLWGHDTRDRLGGERGPAGPRYERDGTVRAAWGDPVGWAGLAKVAPNPDQELAALRSWVARLEEDVARLDDEVAAQRAELAAGAASVSPSAADAALLAEREQALHSRRMERVRLQDQVHAAVRRIADGAPAQGPHDHLRHRRTPLSREERVRERLLLAWSIISTPLLLGVLAYVLLPGTARRPLLLVAALALVLSVEALARGYLGAYLRRLLLVAGVLAAGELLVSYWQWVVVGLFVAGALVVLVVNLRDTLRR